MVKTLADFKRLPVGTKILTVQGGGNRVGKIRTIEHKQSNSLRFSGGSWLEYPPASCFRVENNTIIIESKLKDGTVWNTLGYQVIQ